MRTHYRTRLGWMLALGVATLGAGSVACAQQQTHASTTATTKAAPVHGVQGLWIWRAEAYNTPQARQQLVDFASQYGYNRFLVQIHQVRVGDQSALKLPDDLAALIALAADKGITVEGLDGASDMAFAENHDRTLQILDAVLTFNRSLPEGKRLVGMHYDIEPYTHPKWRESQASRDVVMQDLLAFYQKARQKLDSENAGLLLSSDIPAWYDNKTAPDDHCIVTFNGQTKNLYQHIQDVCDYIGIMSYRRQALGRNSVAELVKNEMAYGQTIGKPVMPALETIPLKEDMHITFYGLPVAEFWKQHALIVDTFKDNPAFGGVLTHSYRGIRDMTENPEGPSVDPGAR